MQSTTPQPFEKIQGGYFYSHTFESPGSLGLELKVVRQSTTFPGDWIVITSSTCDNVSPGDIFSEIPETKWNSCTATSEFQVFVNNLVRSQRPLTVRFWRAPNPLEILATLKNNVNTLNKIKTL